jgi:hypothetical protein
MDTPKLIEHQAGHYMCQTLKHCHDKRIITYSFIFNVTIVFVFGIVTGLILYLLYKQKKTPDQQKENILRDQKYILEKIKSLKEQKQYYLENESITKMPMPDLQKNTHANLFY